MWFRLRLFYCVLLVSTGIIIVLPLVFNTLIIVTALIHLLLQVDWLVMNGRESMVEVLLVPRMVGVVIISVKGGQDSVFMEILDVPILHCVPSVV